MVNVGDLVLVAFFTGIGAGIGSPLGNLIFERLIKRSIKHIIEEDLVELLKKKEINGLELLSRKYDIKKKESE